MILARKLSPEGYGQFNVILAVVSLFTVVAQNLSSNHVITREVTLQPETTFDLFRKIAKIRFISFLLSAIAIIIYIHAKDENTSIIIFSVLLVLANTVWDLAESIAFGYLVTKFTTLFNLSFAGLWLITVLFIPQSYMSASFVLILYTSVFIVRGCLYFYTVWRTYIISATKAISIGIKSIIGMSIPYLWIRLFGALGEQVPIIFLGARAGDEQVGYFAVGFRLIIPITLAVSTALRAVFPFLTRLYFKNQDDFNRRLLTAFIFVLLWGSLIATGLVITSHYWIPYFLGVSYLHSVETFNILAWFGVGMSFDLVLSTVLSSTYKQNALAVITTIDLLILLPLLYFGVYYGAIGLAIAKLLGVLLALVYHVIVVYKMLKVNIHCVDFYMSFAFYILMMGITLCISEFIIKILSVLFVLAVYLFFKKSPLRTNIVYVFKCVKNRNI